VGQQQQQKQHLHRQVPEKLIKVAVVVLQVIALVLFARLAVGCPDKLPASTLLRMVERALDGLEAAADPEMLASVAYGVLALAHNGVYRQLDQESAISLGLRALQCSGERPCFKLCPSVRLL
jgi:hypothetical protein